MPIINRQASPHVTTNGRVHLAITENFLMATCVPLPNHSKESSRTAQQLELNLLNVSVDNCSDPIIPIEYSRYGSNTNEHDTNNGDTYKRESMKKLVQVIETNESALESLMGKRVTFLCLNYIYVGKLVGVNETSVCLKNPAIVYETGKFSDKSYKDEQSLCVEEFFISMNCIESFGELK